MTLPSDPLPPGIYDALLDQALRETLKRHAELRAVLGKLDLEEQPERYARLVAAIVEQALRAESDPQQRFKLCNTMIEQAAGGKDYLRIKQLVASAKPLLLEITPPHRGTSGLPRPHTPLSASSLFTGSPRDPQLVYELQAEMQSADGVDILIAFIKWSGLRLLMAAFEDLRSRDVPVRLITTAYMGASDASAVEWLAGLSNVAVRVSYDTLHTRLHAKAYHFKRHSGFSTAYIGSANLSQAAITAGLEWNLKVTAQDLPHILNKFTAEFETYWNSREFIPFDAREPAIFRRAIAHARNPQTGPEAAVFFDLRPHPFQERILEALERERQVRQNCRNLVIAATGTGKTVIAAFDYKRFAQSRQGQARLLFVAHRYEILQQALATFRNVLRNQTFGELLTGNQTPIRLDYLFCSVAMLKNRRLWEQVGREFYDYIVVDEAHHGTAASYRPVFDEFQPLILLGLTATPERMDGNMVAADFGHRYAAEIRLPEALEEKLLCPFHYFGVADGVSLQDERFWRNGQYDVAALEEIYTGDHALARQRLTVILDTLQRYEPDVSQVRGVGFCVSIRHAEYMAEMFTQRGVAAAAFVSGLDAQSCRQRLDDLKYGRLLFLFTVDKLSEGVDVPDINTVLFLRPTQSLTVFLQQLGRGLRHAAGKDCLTVLDFVGQAHRRYRMDLQFKALLPSHRFAIDREVELGFPHLPSGCSLQLDRLAQQYVLENIRANLRDLKLQIPERLQTFQADSGQELTFGNFIRYHDYDPALLLVRETWSGWKARAGIQPPPADPDQAHLEKALLRLTTVTGPREIARLRAVIWHLQQGQIEDALKAAGEHAIAVYYRIWAETAARLGLSDITDAFQRLARNPAILKDLDEVLAWSETTSDIQGIQPHLPFPCDLELHASYSLRDIQAHFGLATLASAGQRGVGVIHLAQPKAYILLVTFQKTVAEFSPATMYADYPISRELLHWESQSTTSQASPTGQNLIHHQKRDYTILIFARSQKKHNGIAMPFIFLGPADRISFENERPIRMVWQLRYAMPVELFEDNRKGG